MSASPAHRPPSEDELGMALDRLNALLRRARENLSAAGRDPGAARVLLHDWMLDLGARRMPLWRFRQLLAALEARRLVAIDAPFVSPTGVHSSASNRTSGASA